MSFQKLGCDGIMKWELGEFFFKMVALRGYVHSWGKEVV